jgi:predicted aspartyl protease
VAALRGSLDSTHSPVVTITVSVPRGPSSFFDAIIDIGFTGFVQLPERHARRLGLTPRIASEMQYPDGRVVTIPLAWGSAGLGSETHEGCVHVQRGADEALVGVDFLRVFRKTLVLSIADEVVLLLDSLADLTDR